MSSLNLIALFNSFNYSVAMLYNMEFTYSLSDSGQFAGFNLSDIEEHGGHCESEDISDISVSSAHTLDL